MNSRQVFQLVGVAVLSVVVTAVSINLGLISISDTTKPKDRKEIVISYQVNAASDKLEIVTNDSGKCPGGADKGCFKIRKSKNGIVKYEFTTESGWELKQFTICSGTTAITNSCTNDLTLDEQLEFFVMDDKDGTNILLTPKNGEVTLTQLPAGDAVKTFYLFDQNTIKQMYYYNIMACPDGYVSDDQCIYLDPPIENKGRK